MPVYRTKKNGETYIKFLDDEIRDAKSIDMTDFLSREYGWSFRAVGNYYQCREHDSLMIKKDRRCWYWNSRDLQGRNAIDWLNSVEMMDFSAALEKIIGSPSSSAKAQSIQSANTYSKAPEIKPEAEEKKKFVLPPETTGVRSRTFAYLGKTRCLDTSIVAELVKEKMIYEDKLHNVVFVGYDESGKARFAENKMTNSFLAAATDENGKKLFHPKNISGSDKRYSFNIPADKEHFPAGANVLYVFEAPIDLLSHCTMTLMSERKRAAMENRLPNENVWRNVNRLSLSGKSDVALEAYLERNPDITNIVFALDNDTPGLEAAKKMMKNYTEKGYICKRVLPKTGKDFNECLQLLTAEQSAYRQITITQRTENKQQRANSIGRH